MALIWAFLSMSGSLAKIALNAGVWLLANWPSISVDVGKYAFHTGQRLLSSACALARDANRIAAVCLLTFGLSVVMQADGVSAPEAHVMQGASALAERFNLFDAPGSLSSSLTIAMRDKYGVTTLGDSALSFGDALQIRQITWNTGCLV